MYKNILVVTGTGISCSAGIPDVSCCASYLRCACGRAEFFSSSTTIMFTISVPDARIRIVSRNMSQDLERGLFILIAFVKLFSGMIVYTNMICPTRKPFLTSTSTAKIHCLILSKETWPGVKYRFLYLSLQLGVDYRE